MARSFAQSLRDATPPTTATKLAREYGNGRGWLGKSGGWIYGGDDRPFIQGWALVWRMYAIDVADHLTRKLTAFPTLMAMCEAQGNYSPTISVSRGWRYAALADLYDAAQAANGDPRRAYRI